MANHIITPFFRRLSKHKATYLISFIGLTAGLYIATTLALVFMSELSFDSFHANHANKFLLEMEWQQGPMTVTTPTRASIYEDVQVNASIKNSSRVFPILNPIVTVIEGDRPKNIRCDNLIKVDSGFFRLFDFETMSGNPQNLFSQPKYVVLTESFAKRMALEKIVGETIKLNGEEYIICGTVKDWPVSSSLKFDVILSTLGNNLSKEELEGMSLLYVEANSSDIAPVMKALNQQVAKDTHGKGSIHEIQLANQHLDTDLLPNRVSRLELTTFLIVALVILIVTLSNYSNHAIVVSFHQLRNTGIRKMLGAGKYELSLSFLAETCLIVVIALACSVVLSNISTHYLGAGVAFPTNNSELNLEILTAFILITIVSVAFITLVVYVSGSKVPVMEMLSITKTPKKMGGRATRLIVGFQCVITTIFILFTFTVVTQRKYLQNFNIGFDKHQKLIVDFDEAEQGSAKSNQVLQAFKDKILTLARVKGVSMTSFLKSSSVHNLELKGSDELVELHSIEVDESFVSVMGINLVEGRGLSEKSGVTEVLINQSAYDILKDNFKLVLGREFPGVEKAILVGIVDDFLFNGFRSKNTPLLLTYNASKPTRLIVTYDGSINEIRQEIQKIKAANFPDVSQDTFLLADMYDDKFLPDDKLSRMLITASIVSICISLVGLVGIFQFISNAKRREMSIRKVFGASSRQIGFLYFKKYFKLLIISIAFAVPVGYLVSYSFLELFAFKITLGPAFVIQCIVLQLLIVVLVLSFQTVRSAILSPTQELRND